MEIHKDHRTFPPDWRHNWLPKLSRRLKKSLKKQVLRRGRATDYVRNSGRKWHSRDVRLENLTKKTYGGVSMWIVVGNRLIAS